VRARDIMTRNPVTVSAQATVAEAADTLRDLAIRHLPVVRDGALDLWAPAGPDDLETFRERRATPIVRVMSADVVSVDPETSVGEIIALMIESRVGAVPVIEPTTREVLGIVSYIDVLGAVQELIEEA
jgi:acetoin utilization protein AcuB